MKQSGESKMSGHIGESQSKIFRLLYLKPLHWNQNTNKVNQVNIN